ncbi:hypothetical protein [Amycolatopsis sp. cmx-4-68]|uniref:hypothetical protein n=1 Tax=Amycolatopsis sp. cmx-4-68 TaxID=2790938 RepID=UPI00397DE303
MTEFDESPAEQHLYEAVSCWQPAPMLGSARVINAASAALIERLAWPALPELAGATSGASFEVHVTDGVLIGLDQLRDHRLSIASPQRSE